MTKSVSGDGSSDLPSAASGVPRASSTPGTAFGRFRVLHKIGMGSLGPVFRGEDTTTLATVAIKQIQLIVGPERTRLIADELEQLVRTLPQHRHLTRLLAAGIAEDGVTVVSSWAVGEGLDAALGAYGPAAIGDAVERLSQIAGALDAAAAQDVWHGALHPADVIVSATDTHVTGVGVAAILEKAHVRGNVRLPYTAPEVVAGDNSSSKSDQFALAAMAHEWLFGVPVAGPAESSMDVPRLPDVNQAALCDAFTTALAPDPAERFATCTAFVDALRAASVSRSAARPAVAPPVQGDLLMEPTLAAGAPLAIDDLPIVDDVPPATVSEATVVTSAPPPPGHRDRARPVEPEKTVAWRGELAALPAAASRDEQRGLSGAALAAVFVVGLALGGAGGYVVAQRRAPAAPVSSAATDAATAGSTGEVSDVARAGAAPEAAGSSSRPFTDGAVPAPATPPAVPTPASPTPASPAPPAATPRAAVARPPQGTARLLVRSSPGGAAVSVDGVARGTTPLVLRDLPIGARRVTLTRRGYATAERNITLSGDRPSRSIDVTLVPIARAPAIAKPAPATAGSLLVESRPSGAAVTMDGQAAGTTPLTIATVAPGRHTVVITAQGMKPVTATVIVKAGERARVAATLVGGTQDE